MTERKARDAAAAHAETDLPAGCRESCDAVGEPLPGSAGPVAAWIGIRWPKPLWHPADAARSQGLPPDLAERLGALAPPGAKLALRLYQREPRPPTDAVELVLWRPGGPSGQLQGVAPADLTGYITRYLAGEPLPLDPLGRQLFVCTDGRHDACCARHGAPLRRALHEALAERARRPGAGAASPRLAECSHLGGHRFAANCLALPGGALYGRVRPDDVAGLLAALEEDRPYWPRLRGSLAESAAHSAAAAFLAEREGALQWRLESAPTSTGALCVNAWIRTARGETRVRVHGQTRRYCAPASCGDAASETARWVPTHVEPDDSAGLRDGD